MSSSASITTRAVDGVLWRLSQNFSTTLVNFVLQIWLARLLLPEHYGIIALTSVFITISMVFVQTGFTASLIQKATLSDIEVHSVFYTSVLLALILYLLIYIISPFLSAFYSEPLLSKVLRIQSINIIVASLYSVPVSLIRRNFEFKKTFLAGLISSICQGIVGIFLALKGFGVWALVYASLTHSCVNYMIIIIVTRWKPKAIFSLSAVRNIFSFSSKILLINLINTLFNNIKSLIIGRAYNSELLGFYNRGYQIPVLLMNNVDGAINAVTFPVLSRFQDDYSILVQKLRRSLQVSIYFVWPAMIGLAVVSKPLIILLLTEKWLLSIPFVVLTSIICMFWPFSVFTHAINAVGKSGLALKLNLLSKSIALLFMAITYRYGIYYFVGSSIFSSIISISITMNVASRLLGFKVRDVISDCAPTLLVSFIMGFCVYLITYIPMHTFPQLVIQIMVGVLFYLSITWIFKFPSFLFIRSYIKMKFLRGDIK